MTTIAFVDTETLGLDPDTHTVWEIAVIRREIDGSETRGLWQIKASKWELEKADPKALEINRYHERMVVPERYQAADMSHICGLPHPLTISEVQEAVTAALKDAVLVGSNPGFDASFLRPFLGSAPWHYRVVDIATLAAGYLRGRSQWVAVPYSSRDLSRAVGVEPPGADGHQALVDAEWAMRVWDAVNGQQALPERAA